MLCTVALTKPDLPAALIGLKSKTPRPGKDKVF